MNTRTVASLLISFFLSFFIAKGNQSSYIELVYQSKSDATNTKLSAFLLKNKQILHFTRQSSMYSKNYRQYLNVIDLLEDEKSNNLKGNLNAVNNTSKLSAGTWYKFQIIKPGVYKISNKDLKRWGVTVHKSVRLFALPINNSSSIVNPNSIHDLVECRIDYNIGNDGLFNNDDYFLFYARTADNWYYNSTENYFDYKSDCFSSRNYYYLLIDDENPLIIESAIQPQNYDSKTSSFDNYDVYERNDVNIMKSGKEWYSSLPTENIKLTLKNRTDNKNVTFITNTVTEKQNGVNPLFTYTISNQGSRLFSYSTSDIIQKNIVQKDVENDDLKLSISYNSSVSHKAYLDKIIINYRSNLMYNDKQFSFRDASLANNTNVQFELNISKSCKIWNVDNEIEPKQINCQSNNSSQTFNFTTNTISEFVAFNESDCFVPTFIGRVFPQNLHALGDVDMIIVSANSFLQQAEQIKTIHEKSDGLKTVIVSQAQIFNEFSGGRPTPIAIRDFVRYVYVNGNKRLKFLLLNGDGSYDNRNIDFNKHILTYQTNYSLYEISSIVIDDFYALLDENEGITENDIIKGDLDVAVGRLPVNTKNEADILVKKINTYIEGTKSRGNWRNKLLFLADDADDDQTIHMEQASSLADDCIALNKNLIADKIFLDAYKQEVLSGGQRYPSVNKEIESKIKNGCLVFNYTGHGNPLRLAGEIVVDKGEVAKWKNEDKLPLFIAASCSVGRFDDENRKSLGEEMLVSQPGGAIATIASNRTVYSGPNMQLNSNIYKYLFVPTNDNKAQFVGEVLRLAKNKTSGDDFNKHNFTLLGDPALRLAIPQNKVVTDKIDNELVTIKIDTLKALATVTVQGHIENTQGEILQTYNGKIHTTVFDKPQKNITISNDGAPPVTFYTQNSILFNGKSTVKNGEFQFQFIIPKDIVYNIDKGRISYYCDNGMTDGAGSFSDFYVGASSNNSLELKGGPQLRLFMNDTNFVDGGITNNAPTLLIEAIDNYGINVTGSAIGHDATALIDNNKGEQIILNQFYEAVDDSYTKGYFSYPLSTMEAGNHSIDVKIWNINNEYSTETINFVVDDKTDFYIHSFYNYPNPFKTNTRFAFEHNSPNQELKVELTIVSLMGEPVKKIVQTIAGEGNRNIALEWDGFSNNGESLPMGVYYYTLLVTNEKMQVATAQGKMIKVK